MNSEMFRERLHKRVTRKGMWQAQYARELGVTQGFLTNVLKGRQPPNKAILNDMEMSRTKVVVYTLLDNEVVQ